ncbi:hypothetical protein AA313_de0205320 [Arthrobotrys entomopaga]|nr:hypothetical protein AA313_de0205320 [Arthrobotrys entomopaga]
MLYLNHIPIATATIVQIPAEPDMTDYYNANSNALYNIALRIDMLRENRKSECIAGYKMNPSMPHFQGSLTYRLEKIEIALDQLNVAIQTMNDNIVTNPDIVQALLTQYGFDDITAAQDAYDTIVGYRDLFKADPLIFEEFSFWLKNFPGWDHPPASPSKTKNLLFLLWRIEGITATDLNKDANTITVSTEARQAITDYFSSMLDRTRAGMGMAKLAREWGESNLLYEFEHPGHKDFTIAAAFQRIERWYDCWRRPLEGIVHGLKEKLGPLPLGNAIEVNS